MTYIKSRKHALPRHTPQQTLTAATLLAGLALGLPASAQSRNDEDKDTINTLSEVEVKGVRTHGQIASPKFTQPLLDTTQTINVISNDLFNEQGATTLTEALRNSPGVGTFYVGENGNTTTGDAVFMRGFDTSSSIYVDGIRDLGSISRDVFNTEQIEVAKGPAGTDYGRTAPTGAINMVTKQPFLRDDASASVSYGSESQKRVSADWNQTFAGMSGAAFRLNVMAQDSGVPGRDEVERNRWGIAPSLAFGLDTATRFYLDFLHVRQDNLPDGGVPTIGLPGYSSPDPLRPQLTTAPQVDASNFYGTRSDYDDVTANMFTARVEHDFSQDVKLQNSTRWAQSEQQYMLTAFMGSTANLLTPDIDDPSTWTIARSLPTFKDQENRILTNQTNLTANFGSGSVQHTLSTGVEFTREELETFGVAALNGTHWPAANLYDPDPHVAGLQWGRNGAHSEGQTDTAAVYAFDTLTLNERWEVNGGVRFDHYKTDFSSLVPCGGRGGPACGDLPAGTIMPGVDDSTSDNLFNWKLGVLYKPAPNGSIYANYATSQQPPGGSSLELSASANNANNPVFDPQEAKTAEVGTKWNLFGDDLLLTAALYDTRVSNEIVQDPVDQLYYQTGRKRVKGIELSATGNITDAWAVSAGYTVMDTEVEKGPDITADGSSDLTYTPKSAFTAWTTYRLPFGLTIGGGARYSGEMKRGSDGAVGTPAFTEDYWVFDAVATYSFNAHFDLRLNVYNLFDEDYVAAINKSGYRYTPGAPRSAMLTADFRF